VALTLLEGFTALAMTAHFRERRLRAVLLAAVWTVVAEPAHAAL
jgi:hypothetical protein